MARRLAIGSVQLSDRAPRIVAAGGEADLEALVGAAGADLIELRADLCEDPRPETLPALLARLGAGGRPVILTARAAAEGGRPLEEARHPRAHPRRPARAARGHARRPRARHRDPRHGPRGPALARRPPRRGLPPDVRPRRPPDRPLRPAPHSRARRPAAPPPPPLESSVGARAPASLLHRRRPARRLLLTERPLRREQLLLRAPRAPPLLAADARPLRRGGLGHAARARLELVEQLAAGEEAVEGLRALALALDDHAARPVAQHDAGRYLVDVLPALPARAHEVLLQVRLAHAEHPHARGEGLLLLGRDGEHAGRLTIRPVGWPPPRRPHFRARSTSARASWGRDVPRARTRRGFP